MAMYFYIYMEKITLKQGEKPSWADVNVYLDIMLDNKVIGKLGLLSIKTMNSAKIKRANVAIFELNVDYIGFSIPDEFVVGFGMDYNQKYRNLPYIGKIG